MEALTPRAIADPHTTDAFRLAPRAGSGRGRWQLVSLILLSLVCVTGAACGDDPASPPSGNPNPNPNPTPPSPPTDGIPITGTERLAWDQDAASVQALQAMTFRLFVDSVANSLSDVRCATTRSSAGYECSGRLPALTAGRHVLEVAAIANGVESSRSAGLAVIVGRALMPDAVVPADPTTTQAPGPGGSETVCLEGTDCYSAELIATAAGRVTALVPASGGRLFFIDGGRTVRIIQEGQALHVPALTLDGAGTRVTGLAIAPDFEQSRLVYVAWTEQAHGQSRQLNVTRYSELGGLLGQGATIVSGLVLPEDASAPIALDDRGLLYIAMPALGDGAAARDATYSRMVLRFAADGRIPASNPQASPVLAIGYERPSALVWDRVWRRMWLAGEDSQWRSQVAVMPTEADARATWPWSPEGIVARSEVSGLVAPQLALTGQLAPEGRSAWIVAGPGVVHRAPVRSIRQLLQPAPVEFGTIRDVALVTEDSAGGLFLVSGSGAAPDAPSSIWRLTRAARAAVPRTR